MFRWDKVVWFITNHLIFYADNRLPLFYGSKCRVLDGASGEVTFHSPGSSWPSTGKISFTYCCRAGGIKQTDKSRRFATLVTAHVVVSVLNALCSNMPPWLRCFEAYLGLRQRLQTSWTVLS